MAPSFSKSKPQWIYDVFVNFRGKDTRRNFVSHLYAALSNAGINTFLDDENLEKGNELGPELMQAIEGSQISIVVFSQKYTQSSWCLKELVKIMECRSIRGQVVLPVFYDVTPSYVEYLGVTYGEAAYDCIMKEIDWISSALSDVAGLGGWDVRNFSNESIVVKQIVSKVLKRLHRKYLPITDFPVGLESRVEQVIQFLRKKTREVCMVGIWGMGGIGKSTIAKVIYNKLHHEFEFRSFLPNIREVWEKDRGQIDLQEQLLSDIFVTRKMKVHSIEWGKAIIKERLCTKRTLVVLDDVDKFEQLNALCGNRDGIGLGSIIIITTRDVRILDVLGVDFVYGIEELNEEESLDLFSWHSFRKASPREDFLSLSKDAVAYCGGLPLALEVLGCYLYKRKKEDWQSVLLKLERIPNGQIQEILKISFDGLEDHMVKDIFLDICCFFIGKDRAYVTEILNGCDLCANIGITVLVERSLIKVEKNNKLGMHGLLRDMGREIVRESSPEEPEKRSRLWFHEDVLDVLTDQIGTKAVEGLSLKLQRTSRVCFNSITFEKMQRLRLLQLDHVQLIGKYDYLPKHLRWLCWQGFPLKYIPNNFFQKNIVAMDLKRSNLKQVWNKTQLLEKLKILNLSHSLYLTNTPDFSTVPNLERLILKDCPNLSEVHESIGNLSNLLLINLTKCTSLNNLPKTIYQLKSLKTLILSGCTKIDKLEEDIVQMTSLTTLIADNTAVKQAPFSIIRSKNIGYISLCGYEGSARDVFPSLLWSWISPTMNPMSYIPSFWSISSSLAFMDVQDNNLDHLSPMIRSFSKLRSVWVQCKTKFQLSQELKRILDNTYYDAKISDLATTSYAIASQISEHSLRSLLIGMGSYHQLLDVVSKSISKGLTTSGFSDFYFPDDNFPYCLTHTGEGHSVLFKVPHINDLYMKGMILCVYLSTTENMADDPPFSILIVNHTKCTIQIYKRGTAVSFNNEDWQGIISNVGPDDEVEICVAFGPGLIVKRTTVYLIHDESIKVNMEPSSPPKKKFRGDI